MSDFLLAVWSWDGAHKILVSVIAATPTAATIEYGKPHFRRRKVVPLAELFGRGDGTPLTFALVAHLPLEPAAALQQLTETPL